MWWLVWLANEGKTVRGLLCTETNRLPARRPHDWTSTDQTNRGRYDRTDILLRILSSAEVRQLNRSQRTSVSLFRLNRFVFP